MTTQQPYASPEESAAVIVADTRSPEEKLVDQMIADAGAHEQGAEYVPILYRVAVQLAAQRNHFQALAQANGATIIRAVLEYGAAIDQRDELLEALKREIDADCPLMGSPSISKLIEYWEQEKARGRGEADGRLFALRILAKHQPPAAPAANGEPS